MVGTVVIAGVIGYRVTGLAWMDAVYMTVITITTVGYREVTGVPSAAEQAFTIIVIVTGVSTVLYTFTLAVQVVVEGQLRDFVGRRRMNRRIADFSGHTIVCGWGRVGKGVVHDLRAAGEQVVVIDESAERVRELDLPVVVGDATLDGTLRAAGLSKAKSLVAALEGDAENLFVTLSARTINPDLFIVARARADESVPKLSRAGADRVVNPQELGATRMASFVVQPHVAEFVDVVMHERSMEFRMREYEIADNCWLGGRTLRDANLRDRANVLVLAIRGTDGAFRTNPDPDTVIEPGDVVIAVGTAESLSDLSEALA